MSLLSEGPWWPSRYGADDEAGALNEAGAAQVVRAAGLVRSGRIYDLAHVLDDRAPAFPGRTFTQVLDDPIPVSGEHELSFMIERVMAPSQMGTHMDALNHLHHGGRTYNGHEVTAIAGLSGTTHLGADRLPQIVTRGLLVDVAARRGVDHLERGDVIEPSDLTGVDIEPGDAVLFHTGWGRLWDSDPERYIGGEPGPGLAVAQLLADARVAIAGCDTWSFGPVPAEREHRPFEVPQLLNTRVGMTVIENLRLDELARDGVTAFMFVLSHPKLRGATGAWVAPLAVV